MSCVQIPDLPLEQFGKRVMQKWFDTRVPLSGSMELDLRCNLRCLHCYRDGDWSPGTLDSDEVKRALDSIARAGTLWLLMTGGEIFLRRDFFQIYEHARNLGLLVGLFTNGTTVTPRIADRLANNPPHKIEVTLYGHSTEVYERVTGVPGSRALCYRGVELLLERHLPLTVKTVVMRTNQHEFMDLFRFAETRGLPFRWDTQINPNFTGSLVPCNVRLSPEEAVALDFAVPSRVTEYRDFFEARKDFRSSRLFSCGAGSRTFHIDPYGNVTMCLLLREPAFNLRDVPFEQIWNEMFPPLYRRNRRSDHECNDCNLVSLCGKCPAWSLMEKGDLEERVEYACEVGHRRAHRLGHYQGPLDQFTKRSEEKEVRLPVV